MVDIGSIIGYRFSFQCNSGPDGDYSRYAACDADRLGNASGTTASDTGTAIADISKLMIGNRKQLIQGRLQIQISIKVQRDSIMKQAKNKAWMVA